MYFEKLLTHVWRIGREVPEPVEGTLILMEMRHPVPELAEGSRTRMTLIQQIITDKIGVKLSKPLYAFVIFPYSPLWLAFCLINVHSSLSFMKNVLL